MRACCAGLAFRIWALRDDSMDQPALQAAVLAAADSADSEASAAQGRLDSSLRQLVQAAGGGVAPQDLTRLDALETLVSVAQAGALMIFRQCDAATADRSMEDAPAAVPLSRVLRRMAAALSTPRFHSSAAALLSGLRQQSASQLAQLPPGFFDAVMPAGTLSEAQSLQLGRIDAALHDEYAVRRRMLLERVQVTLHSFSYSQQAQQGSLARQLAGDIKASLAAASAAPPTDLLAALRRASVADALAMVGGKAEQQVECLAPALKRVVIGDVPDRGGRPQGTGRARDMPAWKARMALTSGNSAAGAHKRHKFDHGKGGTQPG